MIRRLRFAVALLSGPGPLVLDLDSALTVRRVTRNGVRVPWRRDGGRIVIPTSAARGDTVTTEVDYDGTPRNGLIIRGTGAGRTIFADNWPDRARYWLASQDYPGDKAAVAWSIEAPAGLTVVANGRLEGVDPVAGFRGTRLVTQWEGAGPSRVDIDPDGWRRLNVRGER